MDRIESTIEVDAAPSVCYEKWHHFEQFPHFMENVEEVRPTGEKSWHWVVAGPLGHRSEWDAEVDGDVPGQFISWHSLSGSEVTVSGIVNFKDVGQNKTQVTCQLQYDPPAGALGEIVAHLFANPQKMVETDLENFKHLVEGTNIPVEKACQGEVMQPNPFVVPTGQATTSPASTTSTQAPISVSDLGPGIDVSGIPTGRIDEEGYELIYGLEDDLPLVGTSTGLAAEDRLALQSLSEEESPYLGMTEGAIYSEDLIAMRNDSVLDTTTMDIYAESMDVNEEDLANFTEDLDDEIDIGLGPRETAETYEAQSTIPGAGFGPRESMESVEPNETCNISSANPTGSSP